jgi:lycopene beta-cyclase
MQKQQLNTNYIIAGLGCAGLSLLYHILQSPKLQSKKILVVDKLSKTQNDRTWCFWEKEANIFQHLVCKEWEQLSFLSANYSNKFSIAPYTYKMIKGIDYYSFILNEAKKNSNVTFIQDEIETITCNPNAVVETTNYILQATEYVFNSTLKFVDEEVMLQGIKQHFLGWEIQTETPTFNSREARFMDFTVSQKEGTTFMYVLPTSPTTALVEYTFFTSTILQKKDYEEALKNYITQNLNITNYQITHTEFGVIPMSNYKFATHYQKIIHIGTAAGWVKASTGYAFSFIQKNIQQIVQLLQHNKAPILSKTWRSKKYAWFDATLLYILNNNLLQGSKIFEAIFKKNKASNILAFLNNTSSIWQDLKIMLSVPMPVFLPVALKQLFKRK